MKIAFRTLPCLYVLLAILGFATTSCLQASWTPAQQRKIAKAIEMLGGPGVQMTLYAVDFSRMARGDVTNKKYFHGLRIDKAVQIVTEADQARLLKAFSKGVRESIGWEAECFNPRHGLRIVKGSKTTDFLICFECLQVEADGFSEAHFLTTDSPSKVFDQFLLAQLPPK